MSKALLNQLQANRPGRSYRSPPPISGGQIKALHAEARRQKLDDDAYRDFLQRETGQRSCKGLSWGEAQRCLDALKRGSTTSQSVVDNNLKRDDRPSRALRLEGPYAAVSRALWISAWNLGLIEDRSDRALVAFARRQTGIDHLDWVKEGADGAKVLEALKSWIAREAGVQWELPVEERRRLNVSLTRWRKLAVIQAQVRILRQAGETAGAFLDHRTTNRALDDLARDLGARVRAVKEKADPPSPRLRRAEDGASR